MYVNIAGQRVLRSTYEKYSPIASFMNWHPDKTFTEVAKKFKVKEDTLIRALKRLFPDVWNRYNTSR